MPHIVPEDGSFYPDDIEAIDDGEAYTEANLDVTYSGLASRCANIKQRIEAIQTIRINSWGRVSTVAELISTTSDSVTLEAQAGTGFTITGGDAIKFSSTGLWAATVLMRNQTPQASPVEWELRFVDSSGVRDEQVLDLTADYQLNGFNNISGSVVFPVTDTNNQRLALGVASVPFNSTIRSVDGGLITIERIGDYS